MQSFTLPPSPPLAPYVTHYRVLKIECLEPRSAIVGLPAPSAQLSINFGSSVSLMSGGVEALSTPLMVSGPTVRSDLITLANNIDAVTVTFQPGCAGLFLDMPTAEFVGQPVDAEAVWSRTLSQACYDLEGLSLPRRIERLEAILLSKLDGRFLLPPAVRRALTLTERANGRVRVRELASEVGVSERTLQRHMSERVGLSPKQLARGLRVRHAAERLHRTPEANWAQLALECGFYDQAHLTNEMVALTGHTPGDFVQLDDDQGFYLKPG